MSLATFSGFLTTAGLYPGLIVDLCAEPGVISRARLLAYMERHAIAPVDKDKLIERYCRMSVLNEDGDFEYTVNPIVAGLVNFYERRGKLTHAGFLMDQILEIGRLTDVLQQQLFAEAPVLEMIADTVDKLFLVVRDVRESGYQHYQACMRTFGDMKRNSKAKRIEERIDALKTVHRRYIEPLQELIDPNAESVQKMGRLRQRMADLAANAALLGESVELQSRRARLLIDIQYIDYTLIRHFETLIDTSRSLLNSLIEEKYIKDALAACLGNLDAVWQRIQGKTVLAPGLLSNQSASLERLGLFFSDVAHKKLVPCPRPLNLNPPQEEAAEHLLLFEQVLMRAMAERRHIASWPDFVTRRFATYPAGEQLKAMVVPLTMPNPPFSVQRARRTFCADLKEFAVELEDFDIVWDADHAR